MALDSRYVQLPQMQMQLWDKDLNVPLAAGKVYFWEDNNRTVAKDVYTLSGSFPNYTYVNLGAVITLSGIGTFVDGSGNNAIPFLYPFEGTPAQNTGIPENYFIEVYSAGGVSGGVFQFSVQGVPYATQSAFPGNSASTSENVISNPQFVEVSFNPAQNPVTISTTGTGTFTQIAPDWSIITNGTGTFQVAQIPVNSTVITNPSYVLQITNITGYSTPLILNQTLTNSSRTFANALVSGTFIAASTDGGQYNLTMSYVPSSTGTPLQICTGTTLITGFVSIANTTAVLITPPNTGAAPSATVSVQISIPLTANIQISSVQLCTVPASNEVVEYLEESSARQEDHLFHYYKNSLLIQPKASVLTGWNFCLNPWQFTDFTLNTTIGSSGTYTADQTIISLQNPGSISVTASGNQGQFQISPVAATTQQNWAIIQYVDSTTILPYWGSIMSSLVQAYIDTSSGTNVKFKMRLLYSATKPATVDPVSSWASGTPAFTGQWTEIIPRNDPEYTLTTALSPYAFNALQMPTISASTNYFAIVLYTTAAPLASTDTVLFNRISCVPNEFAIDTPPETFDTVLQQCRFYYEKSYDYNVIPGTVSAGGSLFAEQTTTFTGGTTNNIIPRAFGFAFKNLKRTTSPKIVYYSPLTGAINFILSSLFVNGSSVNDVNSPLTVPPAAATGEWTENFKSSTAVTNTANTVTPIQSFVSANTLPEGILRWHYTCDARLGLIP